MEHGVWLVHAIVSYPDGTQETLAKYTRHKPSTDETLEWLIQSLNDMYPKGKPTKITVHVTRIPLEITEQTEK